MSSQGYFPPLPGEWEPTKATLHSYAQAVGAVPRALAASHPKWWHISLEVRPTGLVTEPMALPEGGSFQLLMDLRRHVVALQTSAGEAQTFSMVDGESASSFGDWLIQAVGDLGLEGDYDRSKFESDDPTNYDPDTAERVFEILVNVEQSFRAHRAGLPGEAGPIQLWPHGFDLAFEWFGTRVEEFEEEGEMVEYPSQLNLGFYPAERSYFYSNPWPFEGDRLLGEALRSGGEWFTDGWEGSILYYDMIHGRPDARDLLLAYAKSVYEVASPTLMA